METVQGEGGINVASAEWLRGLSALCREHGILLIVDDVQMGCGRTGPFFSFESAGITPDIVCLSKAYGLAFNDGDLAGKVAAAAFEAGLLVETAGPRDQVVKLLPPLTVSDAELDEGLSVLDEAIRAVC